MPHLANGNARLSKTHRVDEVLSPCILPTMKHPPGTIRGQVRNSRSASIMEIPSVVEHWQKCQHLLRPTGPLCVQGVCLE